MSTITVKIKFYGAFRKFGDGLAVKVSQGANIKQMKEILITLLDGDQRLLVGDSVLANHDEILPESYILTGNDTLSILPPVCGG